MLFILTVYLLLVWLLFSKLELLKWGWVSGIFVALGGAFILAVFLALFNYLTPSGSFTVVSRVTEVTPNVSGQVIEIPVKRRIGDPPPLIHTRRVPRARLICLSRIRGIRKRHSAQAMQSSQHRAPRRSELLSDLRSRKTLRSPPAAAAHPAPASKSSPISAASFSRAALFRALLFSPSLRLTQPPNTYLKTITTTTAQPRHSTHPSFANSTPTAVSRRFRLQSDYTGISCTCLAFSVAAARRN